MYLLLFDQKKNVPITLDKSYLQPITEKEEKLRHCRLFTTVRDSLGLTYDVSFELNLFDRLNLGWYVISVTSTPGKVCILCLLLTIDVLHLCQHFSLRSLSMPFSGIQSS